MATGIKIISGNITDIPPSGDANCRPVNYDAHVIVNEILSDIFDKAIKKSEEAQQVQLEENNVTDSSDSIIDLTRNYKEEFKNILQNLKCQAYKTQLSDNANLEDQIKKVIDEIKLLETSLRRNLEEGRGDINMPGEIQNQELILEDDEMNVETVLQVINLQEDNSEVSSFNAFPSEDELEEINLISERSAQLSNIHLSAGEIAVLNPVPDPEPEEKLQKPKEGDLRKKKSLGRRLWSFMRKNTRNGSTQTVDKRSLCTRALNYEFS